jgi:hypothetical protein
MKILTALLLALPAAAAAQPAAAPAQAASTPTLTVDQLYAPSSLRDPLLPSTVFGDTTAAKARAMAASEAQAKPAAAPAGSPPPALSTATFPVSGLVITGLMEDHSGRQALLRDPAAGAVYTLRGGRLYDSRKKAVPGVSGVVKGRQAVLMTEDGRVTQLSLPEKE